MYSAAFYFFLQKRMYCDSVLSSSPFHCQLIKGTSGDSQFFRRLPDCVPKGASFLFKLADSLQSLLKRNTFFGGRCLPLHHQDKFSPG